ncbi:LysR family transcriptional regulator [Granulicella sp. WH15]|uniref:LysR family transcriptional regulator n=1 Tax=Granulicella sp. WH15 TaxID=2602070 RepID=UPI0013679224|nr:LysR family transcriptional regulator [Granulicella sp. WH15]QHN05119.1 LysR family transcriptional regulator [Granulicella sp. WH15]
MRLTQLRQADLNLLVVFAVFAEERNVSRAAERLLLSQPAVSRALQRLRDTFHDDLFVRTSAGYELTPQGQRLLQELEGMLPKLDRLLSGSNFDPSSEQASFRIATTDSAASILAPVLCRNILPSATKIRFEFVQWHKGLFDDLTHGSVDLVFSASIVDVPSPLQSQTIYDEEFVCVVDGKSPYKKTLTIAQYIAAEHISVNIQSGIQVAPDKHLAAQGYKRQIAIQVPYHEAAVRCVERTKFIATVPRKFVEGMTQTPAIKTLKAPPEVGGFRYVMIWHPRVNTDAAHVWLRATMREVGAIISKAQASKRQAR